MPYSSTASIFRAVKSGSLVLAALLGASLCARAGTEYSKDAKDKNVIQQPVIEPKFWIDLAAGGEFDIHATKFLGDSAANFRGLPAQIQSRDFSSTHDAGVINGRLEAGYKVLPYLSIFAGFTYSHAGGEDTRRVGRVFDPSGVYGPAGASYNLYGNFGQYQAYSGISGVKVALPRTILDFIHAPLAISPYFSLSGGAKYIETQQADFFAKDGRIVSSGHEALYDGSFVFTGEAQFGYDLKLTRNFDITLESGYGYDTKPHHGTITGIEHANINGDRFYSTVSLGAKLKF